MERFGPGHHGPWWLGDTFSLADIAFYPFFERFPVLAHYRGFEIPETCRGIAAWLDAMRERDSVRAQGKPAEFYVAAYSHYADGSADGSTAREMREA
jgi:glutathione S-transferase